MVVRLIQWFTAVVLAHPRRAAIAGSGVILLGASLVPQIRIADDARALVAEGDPEIEFQLEALSQFTTVDQLLVHLHAPGHADELSLAGELTVRALTASGVFVNARFEVASANALEFAEALLPRRFALEQRDPEALFAPDDLTRALREVREALLAPQGLMTKQYLMRDPTGSLAAVLGRLATSPGLSKLDVESGRFLSEDGQSLLVIATPKGNPFGGADAEASMAVIDGLAAELQKVTPHVAVRPIGAHRFTRDAQRLVSSDVHFSVAMSLTGVLVMFVLFFRRPNLVLVAVPPLLFGASVTAGLLAILGTPVHAIVLAFAAACLGLSVDATIHLVSTTTVCGRSTREAVPVAARRIGPSLSLVMTTTVAGLLALCFARITALQQMGYISIFAIVSAFVGTLLFVPLVLPLVAEKTPKPPLLHGPWTLAVDVAERHPRVVVGAAVVIALVMGFFARQSRIDGDLRNLDTHTPEAQADEAAFAAAFGDPAGIALALVEAPDLDSALARGEQVAQSLVALRLPRVLSPTLLAPSLATFAARRARWCAAPWSARLDAAAQSVGFRAAAFGEFDRELAAFCGPAGEALADPKPALAAFERLLERPVMRTTERGVRLAIAFEADEAGMAAARRVLAAFDGVSVIHRSELNAKVVDVVAGDLPRVGLISITLVALLLLLSFRDVSHPLRALAPCLLALITTFGVFALTDTPINLMNLVVLPILAGVGIDYGVLMADADRDPDEGAPRERAFSLSVAAVTTLADFGSFALADYYALATIGQAVLLAVFSSALYALFLPQALAVLFEPKASAAACCGDRGPTPT